MHTEHTPLFTIGIAVGAVRALQWHLAALHNIAWSPCSIPQPPHSAILFHIPGLWQQHPREYIWWCASKAVKQSTAPLYRLLHSLSLVAIGLSVGYETWPSIGWHHAFVIGWSRYRLGLPSTLLHYGLTWPVGIPNILQTPVRVPLLSPNGRHLPAVRTVQGDCERVYPLYGTADALMAYWPFI